MPGQQRQQRCQPRLGCCTQEGLCSGGQRRSGGGMLQRAQQRHEQRYARTGLQSRHAIACARGQQCKAAACLKATVAGCIGLEAANTSTALLLDALPLRPHNTPRPDFGRWHNGCSGRPPQQLAQDLHGNPQGRTGIESMSPPMRHPLLPTEREGASHAAAARPLLLTPPPIPRPVQRWSSNVSALVSSSALSAASRGLSSCSAADRWAAAVAACIFAVGQHGCSEKGMASKHVRSLPCTTKGMASKRVRRLQCSTSAPSRHQLVSSLSSTASRRGAALWGMAEQRQQVLFRHRSQHARQRFCNHGTTAIRNEQRARERTGCPPACQSAAAASSAPAAVAVGARQHAQVDAWVRLQVRLQTVPHHPAPVPGAVAASPALSNKGEGQGAAELSRARSAACSIAQLHCLTAACMGQATGQHR